jgi:tetratricopeptide (TPR) repeat protein
MNKEKAKEIFKTAWKEFESSNFENAITLCDNLIEYDPNICQVYYLKGLCYAKSEEFESALETFEKSTQKDTKNELNGYNYYEIAKLYIGKFYSCTICLWWLH